jgi:hypothetical protein
MTRPILAAALLLLAPAFVVAQGGTDKPAAGPQDPKAAYDELVKAYDKAISDWQTEAQAAVKKAQAAGEKIPAIAMNPPTRELIGRAQELAGDYAGKDDAVRFLAFIIERATSERNAVKRAVETLASDHAKSKAIGAVLPSLDKAVNFGATEQVRALLDQIVSDPPDADCKAMALATRGTMGLQAARTDEERKAAEKDLREVAALTKDEKILARAKDGLFEIEHLQIGCTVPEIAGVDVEGTPFKLSDYRGKVVLLDFWGFW